MLKLSLLIQLTERVTAPVKKIRSAIRGMGADGQRDVKRLDTAFQKLSGTGRRVVNAFKFDNLKTKLTGLIRKVREMAGPLGMKGLEKAAYGAGYAVGKTLKMAGKFALRGVALAAGGVGFLGGWLTGGVIGTASKFEQYQTMLEGLTGGARNAKKAMAWVQDFAARTPYELDQVMEAFVRAKGVGIDPTTGALRDLGDASAGTNKQLIDAVEAIADAQTGEFERLKEFNITSSTKGSNVVFSYLTKEGKTASKSVKKDMASIQAAILEVFRDKYGGNMERLSRTFAGLWSNLKDKFSQFQLAIANAGVFDSIKRKLEALMAKLEVLSKNGTLQRWAEKLSRWMEAAGDKIWKFATETNWSKLGSDLSSVASAVVSLANAINTLANAKPPQWVQSLSSWKGLIPWAGEKMNGWAFGAGAAANGKPSTGAAPSAPRRLRPSADQFRQGGPPLLTRQRAEVGGSIKLDVNVKDDRTTTRLTRLQSNNPKVPLTVRGSQAAA